MSGCRTRCPSSPRGSPTGPSPRRSAASSSRCRRRCSGSPGWRSASRCCSCSCSASPCCCSSAPGVWGINQPGRLGLRDHQLRLVDRHRPRRHADLGDPLPVPAAVAHVDQPRGRGDDALRRHLRAAVPAAPHRPAVAGRVLAAAVPEHHGHVAELPQPAHLGRLRGLDLRHHLGRVLVHRADPRPGDHARPGEEHGSRS